MVVYICQCYSLNLSHPSFPTCVHMFILYIWVSTLALEIGPPYHFSRVHVYALIPDNSVGKESTCNSGDPFDSWVGKIHWTRDRLPTPVFLGFPCGSAGKESTCNAGDLGSIPGLGRYPGEGKGYPLQYCSLENSMDCTGHGVTKSWTRLTTFTSLCNIYFYGLLHFV